MDPVKNLLDNFDRVLDKVFVFVGSENDQAKKDIFTAVWVNFLRRIGSANTQVANDLNEKSLTTYEEFEAAVLEATEKLSMNDTESSLKKSIQETLGDLTESLTTKLPPDKIEELKKITSENLS